MSAKVPCNQGGNRGRQFRYVSDLRAQPRHPQIRTLTDPRRSHSTASRLHVGPAVVGTLRHPRAVRALKRR